MGIYDADNLLSNARLLADRLETVKDSGISIAYAHIGQDAHVITVGTREDAERLAQRLGATERTRFGWRLAHPRYSTLVELVGLPEVHPDPRKDALGATTRQGYRDAQD